MKRLIILFPIITILFFVLLKIEFSEIYLDVTMEDRFTEYIQNFLYCLSFLFASSIAIGFFKTKGHLYGFLYLVLSIGFIFVCMEEVGWGVRVFGMTVPDYFKQNNVQVELFLNNLGMARPYVNEAYILIGFFGVFSCFMLPNRIKVKYGSAVNYLVPNRFLAFYFFPVFAVYAYISYMSRILVHWTKTNAFHIGPLNEGYFVD